LAGAGPLGIVRGKPCPDTADWLMKLNVFIVTILSCDVQPKAAEREK